MNKHAEPKTLKCCEECLKKYGACKNVPWCPIGAICLVISLALIAGTYGIFHWHHTSTASGIRALTDQKAELANGLNRHITIYTADGNVIAEYEGKIDLEDNQGGYVLFDYEGKRYTYYNCFVESIAEIGG